MYYSNSIKRIRELIKEKYPDVEPADNPKDIPSHCLWMCDRIEEMPAGVHGKPARWIGWIFGSLEAIGLIENKDSRDMVRSDKAHLNLLGSDT